MKDVSAFIVSFLIAQTVCSQSIPTSAARPATTSQAIWFPAPIGPRPLPSLPPINLLESVGEDPLGAETGAEKCLLVVRRGSTILAVELAPLTIGPRFVG
jgi:hypothetical protein